MARPGQDDVKRRATAKQELSNVGLHLWGVVHTVVHRSSACTREYHVCLERVFQEGRGTGATEGSMPVGSTEIIYEISIINIIYVLLP